MLMLLERLLAMLTGAVFEPGWQKPSMKKSPLTAAAAAAAPGIYLTGLQQQQSRPY